MRNDIEHTNYSDSERLAMLETRAAELERMMLGMADADGTSARPLTGADVAAPDTAERTEALISRGRQSARRGRRARKFLECFQPWSNLFNQRQSAF